MGVYVVKKDIPKEETGCVKEIKVGTELYCSNKYYGELTTEDEDWVCDLDSETFDKYIK